jgi:uncharacterized membrane protein
VRRQWSLSRRVSSTPLGVGLALGLVACVAFGIAIGFASMGAWPILPFAGLEILGLAAALVVHARQLGQVEHVSIADDRLVIETHAGGRAQRFDWPSTWVRVETQAGVGGAVIVTQGRQSVAIARCLNEDARRRFARELKAALQDRS